MISTDMKRIILILTILTAVCFAADEIRYGDVTGADRYCRLARGSDLKWWDTVAAGYATSPTWANSAVDLGEAAGLNLYTASMPASAAGRYHIFFYDGTKATAANTDDYVWGYDMEWDGTAEVAASDIIADVNGAWTDINAIVVDVNAARVDINVILSDVNSVYAKIMDANDANSLQADIRGDFVASTGWLRDMANIVRKQMEAVVEYYHLDSLTSGGIRDRADRKRN